MPSLGSTKPISMSGFAISGKKNEHRFTLVLDAKAKRDPEPSHLNTRPIYSQLHRTRLQRLS